MAQVASRLPLQEGPYEFSKYDQNCEKFSITKKISHIQVESVYIRDMSLSKCLDSGACLRVGVGPKIHGKKYGAVSGHRGSAD
jgi:hypothetical protein